MPVSRNCTSRSAGIDAEAHPCRRNWLPISHRRAYRAADVAKCARGPAGCSLHDATWCTFLSGANFAWFIKGSTHFTNITDCPWSEIRHTKAKDSADAMPRDKAANLFVVLEELEVFLATTGEIPSSLSAKTRSGPDLLEWLFGASAGTSVDETDANKAEHTPHYDGLLSRLREQLGLNTKYWKGIAEQRTEDGLSRTPDVWINRKWVHGAMVPGRLNQRRLWDRVGIVFDPADGSFATLNRNLVYEADFVKIKLPRWQFPIDTITVFEDVVDPKSSKTGSTSEKKKVQSPETATGVTESSDRPPAVVYVVEGKRGPHKRGAKSAMVQIITFPLIMLGPVVSVKRVFGRISNLYVLTSRAGREETMMPKWSPSASRGKDKSADDTIPGATTESATLRRPLYPLPDLAPRSSLAPPLSVAATASDVGGDTDERTKRPPLHELAAAGKKQKVDQELKQHPDRVDELDSFGRTPLSWAAANGHVDVVNSLLGFSAGPDVTSLNLGRTPLWWAAGSGHDAVVGKLLEASAKPDTADSRDQRTGLWWAAKSGHKAVVKMLMKHGCDARMKDKHGQSPTDVAKNDEIRKLLNPSDPGPPT